MQPASMVRDNIKVKVKVTQSCPTLCDPIDYTVHGILQARILEWQPFPYSKGSSQPKIKPRSPTLQADSLPVESPGKPKNIQVGSLSLLQWIFPTKELNRGLPHCRQILYQLNYQGIQKQARRRGKRLIRESDQQDASDKYAQIKSFIRIQNNLFLSCLKKKLGAKQIEI